MFVKWSSSIPEDCTPIMNCYTVVIKVMNFPSVLNFLNAGPVILVITTSMCKYLEIWEPQLPKTLWT